LKQTSFSFSGKGASYYILDEYVCTSTYIAAHWLMCWSY